MKNKLSQDEKDQNRIMMEHKFDEMPWEELRAAVSVVHDELD